jgi:uncharacterized delta-60 repeat protein
MRASSLVPGSVLLLAVTALCGCNSLLDLAPPRRRGDGGDASTVKRGGDGKTDVAEDTTGNDFQRNDGNADGGDGHDIREGGDRHDVGEIDVGVGDLAPDTADAGDAGGADGVVGDLAPDTSDAAGTNGGTDDLSLAGQDAGSTRNVPPGPSVVFSIGDQPLRLVRGQSVSRLMAVERRAGFNDGFSVLIDGLPVGVTLDTLTLAPGDTMATLTLRATLAAALGAASVSLVAPDVGASKGPSLRLIVQDPPGSRDVTFGKQGRVLLPIGAGDQNVGPGGVRPQADGTVLIVGNAATETTFSALALARLTSAGDLDPTFGADGNGVALANVPWSDADVCFAAIVMPSGSIVATGFSSPIFSYDHAVLAARFTAAGIIDATFGFNGLAVTQLDSDAKGYFLTGPVDDGEGFVVGGFSTPGGTEGGAFLRYSGDGTLDATFGGGGTFQPAVGVANWMAPARAGNLLAAVDGPSFTVLGLTAGGVLDSAFAGGAGVATVAPVGYVSSRAVAVMVSPDDGGILVAGTALSGAMSQDIAVTRLTKAGALDTTFGQAGWGLAHVPGGTSSVLAAALQDDGAIVVAGQTPTASGEAFTVVRFSATGALDTTFGPGGRRTFESDGSNTGTFDPTTLAQGIAVDDLGRIVVAGRIGPVGARDSSAVVYRLWP